MEATLTKTVVITDTNVLINFVHIGQVELLARLPSLRFQLPIEVLEELTDPGQRESIEAAIAAGQIDLINIDAIETLALFGELRDLMGRGEAACLAIATTDGHCLASDERKRFRKKAVELIGETRILRTEDLLLTAIRSGHISVEQADGFKDSLALKRYVIPVKSLAELM